MAQAAPQQRHTPTASAWPESSLPLFPLQAVLFPGGLLSLKVFEARYLDLVTHCLREQRPFGVVALRKGGEVRDKRTRIELESTGVLAELIDVDSAQPGILHVRCRGTNRFAVASAHQREDGLWLAEPQALPDDAAVRPRAALQGAVQGLANAIATLEAQGAQPFLKPYALHDAGWVANRWCEILPIPLSAKQKLMELDDPSARLQLVAEFLRSKGVVT